MKQKSNSEKVTSTAELSSDAAVPTLFNHRAERGMVGAEEKEREGEESEEITGWVLGPGLQRPHLARGG